MVKLEVFDPPMCCSSGVCDANVDPAVPRFAAALEVFKRQGVEVRRYNMAQEPMAFVENEIVRSKLENDNAALPMILLDGKLFFSGEYPSAELLAVALAEHLPDEC